MEYINVTKDYMDTKAEIINAAKAEEFIPPQVHHRMTTEFRDFAEMIEYTS